MPAAARVGYEYVEAEHYKQKKNYEVQQNEHCVNSNAVADVCKAC